MKAVFKIIPVIAFLLTGLQLIAQVDEKERKRYEHFKERSISKTYPASGNTLNIENQFGRVRINVWDKNEIKVDVHIEASSTHKEMMEATYEKIDVKERQQGSTIYFETVFSKEKEKNYNCNNCSNTMSIDYEVYMPATNKLVIQNSFGSTTIPDYKGSVSVSNKYGTLTAGKMDKLEKLEVEFGKAKLKYLENADVTFKYSTINIDNLSGANTINMEFCSYSQINLTNELTSLKLNDSYSSVHLKPSSGFSASYTVTTSYGNFVDKTGQIKRTDTPDEYGPDLNKRFEGKTGSGAAKINISSNFGKVMIGEGTKEDMKEKKKVRV